MINSRSLNGRVGVGRVVKRELGREGVMDR